MIINIDNKKVIGIVFVFCLFWVVKFYGYNRILLFLTTYGPPYYITGLTLYDEELRLEGSEQYRYGNIKTITINKVLDNRAVFARVEDEVTGFSGKDVLYVHDGKQQYYGGLRSKTFSMLPCPRSDCSICCKEYCNEIKWIGEYVNPYEGVRSPIPVIKIVKKNCEGILDELKKKAGRYNSYCDILSSERLFKCHSIYPEI